MSLPGPAQNRVFREILRNSQLLKYFSAFYGARWFITAFEQLVANSDPETHKSKESHSIPLMSILTLLTTYLGHPHHLLHISPPKHHAHTIPSSSRVTSPPNSPSLI